MKKPQIFIFSFIIIISTSFPLEIFAGEASSTSTESGIIDMTREPRIFPVYKPQVDLKSLKKMDVEFRLGFLLGLGVTSNKKVDVGGIMRALNFENETPEPIDAFCGFSLQSGLFFDILLKKTFGFRFSFGYSYYSQYFEVDTPDMDFHSGRFHYNKFVLQVLFNISLIDNLINIYTGVSLEINIRSYLTIYDGDDNRLTSVINNNAAQYFYNYIFGVQIRYGYGFVGIELRAALSEIQPRGGIFSLNSSMYSVKPDNINFGIYLVAGIGFRIN